MPFSIIDEGFEPNLATFEREIAQALYKAGHIVRDGFLERPPKVVAGQKHLAGPLPGGFYTVRQQRYVTSALDRGELVAPYLRTGNLERSWSVARPARLGDRLYVDVFSDPSEAPYNRYVQDDELQVPMHDDWPTPESVTQEKETEAMEPVIDVLQKWGFS